MDATIERQQAPEWNSRRAGPSGELRCGHQVAAVLGEWDIAPQGQVGVPDAEGRWSLVAEVVDRNAFWLEDPGALELVLVDRYGLRLRFRDLRRVFDEEKLGLWGAGAPEVLG